MNTEKLVNVVNKSVKALNTSQIVLGIGLLALALFKED